MKKIPSKAILDGDIILYRAAFWGDVEGIDVLEDRLRDDIRKWTPKNVDEVLVAFSDDRSNNFRRDFWPSYKSKRDGYARPECFGPAREIFVEIAGSYKIDRLEADDLMGIGASSGNAIAVTVDKDLKGVPGWHWNPDKDKDIRYVSKKEAYRFFCMQWLAGDSVDGVPGLWRIGPKKAEKLLDETDPEDWEKVIIQQYIEEERPEEKKVDMEPIDFAVAMARCVRILHHREYDLGNKEFNLLDLDPYLKVG